MASVAIISTNPKGSDGASAKGLLQNDDVTAHGKNSETSSYYHYSPLGDMGFTMDQFAHKIEIYSGRCEEDIGQPGDGVDGMGGWDGQYEKKLMFKMHDAHPRSVATVYRAVDTKSRGNVVVKVYHKDKMQPKHHHKLMREIDAMKQMNGPYVAELFGTFSNKESICLVMEQCEGGDLFKSLMKLGGRLDEHCVCVQIITPLLRVLEKMHHLQIMHRDIKPENIFLTRSGKLRLGDFGLAMDWSKELPFSRSGTLDYMAPEVLLNPATQLQESPSVDQAVLEAKGIKPFTCAVDVWAVGILAYELVCGRPPFEVEDEVKTVTKIIYSNSIKFPSTFSPLLTDFVRHALQKDPQMRPDAKTLLTHPWIQSNIHAAIASAPSVNLRHEKEELLRPLSINSRAPQKIPAASSHPKVILDSAIGSYAAPAVPMTPQPAKSHSSAMGAAMMHRQRVHVEAMLAFQPKSCFHGPSNEESPQHSDANGPTLSGLQRQPSAPSQQHMQVQPAAYRTSPLSRASPTQLSNTATPTKAYRIATPLISASSAVEESQSDHQWQLQRARLQLHQMQVAVQQQQQQCQARAILPQATSAPGTAPHEHPNSEALRVAGLSEPGGKASVALGVRQMEMILKSQEGAGVHGVVQIVRGPLGLQIPSSSGHSPLPPQLEMASDEAYQASSPVSACLPMLKHLCMPKEVVSEDAAMAGVQYSPAAPAGQKERYKWHLARQAGAQ